jgi:type I restriction enzyme S subunit
MIEQLRAMPKYEVYKESGESWINEIPKHWEIRKLKQVFYEKKHKKNVELNCGSISYGKVVIKDDEKIPYSTKESYQEVLNGEFLINPLNLNYDLISLRIALSYIDVVVSPGYIVLKHHKNINKEYFKYLLHRYDVAYMKLLGSGVRQTINFNHIANSILLFPPLAEQTAIAAFLDRKTAQIDQAVAIKEKQIALLKERKQILIQNAVTRGLDHNIPMRDSGVEWIGKIPVQWELRKLNHICKLLVDGTHHSPKTYENGDYKYITAKNIKEWGIDFTELTYVSSDDHFEIYKRCPVQRGDILYIKDGATAGIATVNDLDEQFSMLSSVALIRTKSLILPNYLKFYLNSETIKGFIKTQIVGGAITRLTLELINKFKVIVPPLEDQTAIITHIETESTKIDLAISIQQQQIDKLKEYKATLIDSAVTGKIRVPELVEETAEML